MESAVHYFVFRFCIKVNNDNIETWIWRKPTHTGLLLNYNANCPKKWKFGLISCLLYRVKLICSNNFLFLNEVGLLRNMFASNGYPIWFFEKCLKKFNEKLWITILRVLIMFITLISHILAMTPDVF